MRCNVGVDPIILTDQHLIAEYRELPMVVGQLRQYHWEIKSPVPKKFNLGTGHINFLKNKLIYLDRRHKLVKKEMTSRGFKCDTLSMNPDTYPDMYCNDWEPTIDDSMVIRNRIVEKLQNQSLVGFWRYKRKTLSFDELEILMEGTIVSELFIV